MKIPEKNWLEWLVFGLSTVLVLATLGYLAYDAVTAGTEEPEIAVQLGAAAKKAGGIAVPVAVTNQGDKTAEDVHVEVVWPLPEGREERGEIEIMHLPRDSTRQGWVTFSGPLRSGGRPAARVVGYRIP